MTFTKKEVLRIIDILFHRFASGYRSDAENEFEKLIPVIKQKNPNHIKKGDVMNDVSIPIDMDTVIKLIAFNLSDEQIVKFVKGINESVGSRAVAKLLYDYFKEERENM